MIGTVEHPLESFESKEIALALLRSRFKTPGGRQGLIGWKGSLWLWDGKEWSQRDRAWLDRQMLLMTADLYVETPTKRGSTTERLAPEPGKARAVADYVEAFVTLDEGKMPMWLNGEGPDPDHCVGCLDGVLDVAATAKAGSYVILDRDESWFDNGVLPTRIREQVPQAQRWVRCLEEWGGGDERWAELHRRTFGYACMGTRKYQRWFLWYGKVRSGKGTGARVLRHLLGRGYKGMDLAMLAGPWGFGEVGQAKALVVDEVVDLEDMEGEAACACLKTILSQGEVVLNRKYQETQEGSLRAVPILQANLVPNLPNKGQGLSSKMVLQPFNVSFLGKEDWMLEEKLKAETAGIGRWALDGAVALEVEQDQTKKFGVCAAAEEGYLEYRLRNNAADAFLDEACFQNPQAVVTVDFLWGAMERWGKVRGVKPPHRNRFVGWLEKEGTWHFDRVREHGKARCLRGLGVKMEWAGGD